MSRICKMQGFPLQPQKIYPVHHAGAADLAYPVIPERKQNVGNDKP